MALRRNMVCNRAKAKVEILSPIIQKIYFSDLEKPEEQQNPSFRQFFETLENGAGLLKKCENNTHSESDAIQIDRLEQDIQAFSDLFPAYILLELINLRRELRDILQVSQPGETSAMPEEVCENCEIEEGLNYSAHDMALPKSEFIVGLDKPIGDVKSLLFQEDVSIVGVYCAAGGRKTTLALHLRDDVDITGHFRNVVFVTVSKSPNVKVIIETMWDELVGRNRPEFQNVEDARRQLQGQLQWQSESTLVILDDVWSRASLEKLIFEGRGFKTLVTTRDSSTIPKNHITRLYKLPLLGDEDALSLLCFWAFGQPSIPANADANLVKEVVAECGGNVLALKVIGRDLNGGPPAGWMIAKHKLSKGESISDYHRDELLSCLETSVTVLNDEDRECFLDLGLFPEGRKICADELLDIWVYVRKLEWHDAFSILWELKNRYLLDLTSNSRSPAAISHSSRSDLYFSQQNVMRHLAIYLGGQGSQLELPKRKRLVMPSKENNLPREWELLKDSSCAAQFVSIHTGPMDTSDWHEINFPETEVLVLHFAATEYHLPPFIKSMKNLKVLMICNYSSSRAIVNGLDALSSLPQLRSVRMEGLVAPNIENIALHNLEKLSLSLCEGFGSASTFNYTKVQDFSLDHCSDLVEMPPAFCHMPSARIWSLTNCHLVQKLPFDVGNLSCLRVLRLSALPGLKELPPSIGTLEQLEYVDISFCEGLTELPKEIGQLKKLKEIDMRGCSRLKRLPMSVSELRSLKLVI